MELSIISLAASDVTLAADGLAGPLTVGRNITIALLLALAFKLFLECMFKLASPWKAVETFYPPVALFRPVVWIRGCLVAVENYRYESTTVGIGEFGVQINLRTFFHRPARIPWERIDSIVFDHPHIPLIPRWRVAEICTLTISQPVPIGITMRASKAKCVLQEYAGAKITQNRIGDRASIEIPQQRHEPTSSS